MRTHSFGGPLPPPPCHTHNHADGAFYIIYMAHCSDACKSFMATLAGCDNNRMLEAGKLKFDLHRTTQNVLRLFAQRLFQLI